MVKVVTFLMKYFGIYYWQLRVTPLVPSADDKSRVTISAYSYVYVCRMEILERKKGSAHSLSPSIPSKRHGNVVIVSAWGKL